MVHTFEIYTPIPIGQALRILDYRGVARNQKKFIGVVNVNGIARLSLWPRGLEENGYLLKVVVNPAKLLYGYDAFETVATNPQILHLMSTAFATAMERATG